MWWSYLPQSIAPWLVAVAGSLHGQLTVWTFEPPAWDPTAAAPTAAPLADWLADAAAVADCEAQLPVVRALCLESLAEDLAGRDLPRDIDWLLYLWDRHGAAPKAAVYRVIAADPAAAGWRLELGRMLGTSFALRSLASDLLELHKPGAGTAAGALWQHVRPAQDLKKTK